MTQEKIMLLLAMGVQPLCFITQPSKRLKRNFLASREQSGIVLAGVTPWGSWISCEETNAKAGGNYAKDHGYNFEVPARADSGLKSLYP